MSSLFWLFCQWEPCKLEQISEEMVGHYFSQVNDEEWEDLTLPAGSKANVPIPVKSKDLKLYFEGVFHLKFVVVVCELSVVEKCVRNQLQINLSLIHTTVLLNFVVSLS